MIEDGQVRELIKPNGGNWGGTRVDGEYMDFIKCLIGKDATKCINKRAQNIFFETCREFEMAKRTIKPQSDIKFRVRIPFKLGRTYAKVYPGENLRSKETVLTKKGHQFTFSFKRDKLEMASKDAEKVFEKCINKINDHLKNLFRLKNGRGISTIILVGGFAESPMLLEGIKSTFPEMRTIVPKDAPWSVLRGGVIFGHDPSLIRQRRSKYTYGICVIEKFDSSIHDEKYKYEKKGELRCANLFRNLLKIDEVVTVGQYQRKQKFYIEKFHKEGDIELYSSTTENPKYIDELGCSYIGCLLPKGHSFLLNEDIYVEMCFGETEIEFVAYQPKSKEKAVYYLGQ